MGKAKKVLLSSMVVLWFTMTGIAQAERGDSGTVKILFWQAPSTMNPYFSGGIKETEASSMVLEPLARYDQDGMLTPWLAKNIPTLENGGIPPDLMSITWTLAEGILWADGTLVTTDDILFTYRFCTNPESGCNSIADFDNVKTIEAIDKETIEITFNDPTPYPYVAFVGSSTPILQKKQFENCIGSKAIECSEESFYPIGTGPFRVTEFRPNDIIELEVNENYRFPDKPGFANVTFKGGGDAIGAGRAVLVTGEFDYAWNLQLKPDILTQLESNGKGKIISSFGTSVESIIVNLTNPSSELGDERSTTAHPHPFLTDINVRKALSLAIDRNILNEIGYGISGKPNCNVIAAPPHQVSRKNDSCLVQNISEANRLLDEAGWKLGSDGVRSKNGIRLSVLFQTSTNPVRQDFQALIKQWWSEIGVEAELRNINASVYFGGDPGNPDTLSKFHADLQMYTSRFSGTDPESALRSWICGYEPSPQSNWRGSNIPRYCDPDYDILAAKLQTTGQGIARNELAKTMNDKIVKEYIIIPLIHRGRVSAHSNSLGGVKMNTWDAELWNIADWIRKDGF